MQSWYFSNHHAMLECGPSLNNDTVDLLVSERSFVYPPCRDLMTFEVGLLQLAVQELGGHEVPMYRRNS